MSSLPLSLFFQADCGILSTIFFALGRLLYSKSRLGSLEYLRTASAVLPLSDCPPYEKKSFYVQLYYSHKQSKSIKQKQLSKQTMTVANEKFFLPYRTENNLCVICYYLTSHVQVTVSDRVISSGSVAPIAFAPSKDARIIKIGRAHV